MSLAGQREEIRDYLMAVPGLQPDTYRPASITVGSAWPTMITQDRTPQTPGWMVSWRVWVVLDADERAAVDQFDQRLEEITEALADFGYAYEAAPTVIVTDGGDLYALTVTVRREA